MSVSRRFIGIVLLILLAGAAVFCLLQDYIKKMKEEGIELLACKACADSYGVSEKLEEMGIEVKYMGAPLTEMLKSDWKTITF